MIGMVSRTEVHRFVLRRPFTCGWRAVFLFDVRECIVLCWSIQQTLLSEQDIIGRQEFPLWIGRTLCSTYPTKPDFE